MTPEDSSLRLAAVPGVVRGLGLGLVDLFVIEDPVDWLIKRKMIQGYVDRNDTTWNTTARSTAACT